MTFLRDYLFSRFLVLPSRHPMECLDISWPVFLSLKFLPIFVKLTHKCQGAYINTLISLRILHNIHAQVLKVENKSAQKNI